MIELIRDSRSFIQVIEKNPEAQHAGHILDDNRDSYLLNPCHVSGKYVVLELCEDILIDTIHFANFEIFSSTISEVRVSIADRLATLLSFFSFFFTLQFVTPKRSCIVM